MSQTRRMRWFSKPMLLSQDEMRGLVCLHDRLCEAAPELKVFANVSVAHLACFHPPDEQADAELLKAARRRLDFLLCRREGGVVAAVAVRASGDAPPPAFANGLPSVASVLGRLGIPLLEFRTDALPSVDSLRSVVASLAVGGCCQRA